ncbi:MAG: glycogen/starch/alpha-glucan phosphorylase [Lachnospiraceae bacterium]|nr:glycogen/starch/alpha-glucan phosphorylase [Lachnospiraceae bacterium]
MYKKFNNKTNDITFRRWIFYCNQELSGIGTIFDRRKL